METCYLSNSFFFDNCFSPIDWSTLSFLKFETCGTIEHHGFARNRLWAIDEHSPPLHDNAGKACVDLLLKPSEDDLKCWPHGYRSIA